MKVGRRLDEILTLLEEESEKIGGASPSSSLECFVHHAMICYVYIYISHASLDFFQSVLMIATLKVMKLEWIRLAGCDCIVYDENQP